MPATGLSRVNFTEITNFTADHFTLPAGLEVMSKLFGVYEAPNLVFTACIFAILIYLLHLSVVASKLHKQNKQMAHDIALLKEKIFKEY